MLGHNQETFRYIQDNFPDSLTVARSVSDYRLQEDLNNVEPREEKSESKGVKLKRRVSSMMRTKSILKKKEALVEDGSRFDDITVSKTPGWFTVEL